MKTIESPLQVENERQIILSQHLLNFLRDKELISGKTDYFDPIFKICLKYRITYLLFYVFFVSVVFAKLKPNVNISIFF